MASVKRLVLAMVLIFPVLTEAFAKGTADTLPCDLSAGIFVRIHSNAPGIQWILDSYKRNFLLDRIGDQGQAAVEDFSLVELEEASVAFLEPSGKKTKMVFVSDIIPTDASITFKIKHVDFKLKIKERSEDKGLQGAIVKALLGAWVSAKDRTFLEHEVAYSPSLEAAGKVCAYAVRKNRIIVGNDLSLVQGALRSTLEATPSQALPDLKEFLQRFEKPQDILIYLNNQNGFLNRLNAQWEKKLKIPLLTGVSSLRCGGIFVDIVDQDHLELRGIFLVEDPPKVSETKQDLAFLSEFLRRKMLTQGIRAVAHLDEAPGQVLVRMNFSNTTAFLTKFLKKGRIKKTSSTLTNTAS